MNSFITQLVLIVPLRGRRGTYGTGLALVVPYVPRLPRKVTIQVAKCHACVSKLYVSKLCVSKLCACVCVCACKLCVSKLCVDKLCVSKLCGFLRGRRGTWRHVAALCVARVAL